MSRPLELNSAQQNWLAEVCVKASELKHAEATGKTINFQEIGEWFASHVVDGNLQKDDCFSVLYDRLHRSGANF
jgi:hypothetical protein